MTVNILEKSLGPLKYHIAAGTPMMKIKKNINPINNSIKLVGKNNMKYNFEFTNEGSLFS